MKLYRLFKKTPFFLSASNWMKASDNPIESSEKSRKAVIIPFLLIQYGSMMDKVKGIKTIWGNLSRATIEMRKSAKGITKNPNTGKRTISAQELQDLEQYAKSLGISKLGYTTVNSDFIFKDFKILYDRVIIVAMEMDRQAMKHNPSQAATSEIWRTYSGLGVAVNQIASWLRERGFNCQASPAVGGDIMRPPVAQDAGIGVIGKNGLLITPEFGPSLRLAAIFVDIDNLPLKTIEDNEHLWVRDFCETCNHCVKSCPGKAIYEQTKILDDGYPIFIDREKCAPHFSKNCSQCISSCPFITGNYHNIKATYEQRNNTTEEM